ncbi:MAG: hypothetical protein GYA56_11360 [Geobacteraceae bacterium]|nr:hypothetical protein [Geobacteraceae bacterium]
MKTRTMLTALATTLMFFSGALCEVLAYSLDTESVSLPVEESEFDSRIKCPPSERRGGKDGIQETATGTGNRTFEELRAKRGVSAARVHGMVSRASGPARMRDDDGNGGDNPGRTVIGEPKKPDEKDAVILHEDLGFGRIRAVTAGTTEDGGAVYSHYRVTVDVHNKGERGTVLILLSGKGRDGREIVSVPLKDVFDGRESKTLTAAFPLTSLKSCQVQSWEVFRAYKFAGPA